MRKPNPSILRSLFEGDILEDLAFPYPTLDKDEAEVVKIVIDNLEQWAAEHHDAAAADAQGSFSEGTLEALGDMGIFGLVVPEEYGGLGLSQMGYGKVYEAVTRIDGSLSVTVGGHCSIGMKGLLVFGTEAQKRKYLPDLATGAWLAAFALTEPGAGSDVSAIQTRAEQQSDGSWVLNGQKLWITNGGIADFFTIFAKTPVSSEGKTEDRITAFLLTWGVEGFTRGPEEHKLGIKASSTVPLFFDNVVLPADSVLGEVGEGFKVAMTILNTGRLGLSLGTVGGAKAVINEAAGHSRQRQQFGRPISEFELIQGKLAQMTLDTYAAESMAYLTAGLADRGDVDYSMESAVCKVYASERTWAVVNEGLQIMGGLGYMQGYPLERALRDARINQIFEGTNEILRLFIALVGLRGPGEHLQRLGEALRNPLRSIAPLARFAAAALRRAIRPPRLTQLHPLLRRQGVEFVRGVQLVRAALRATLRRSGRGIVDRQLILQRYADTAIDLYGMLAVLSRVTGRLNAVGEGAAERELNIARTFFGQAGGRIRGAMRQTRRNRDRTMRQMGADVNERKGYDFPV
ncbi:MAG: acyl-CoA dehydrogenase family protein [Candidatus Neomarinimicrobiota bacterium]